VAVRKTKKGAALRRWFKEDWRTPRGNKDYSKGENTFRPTKRITKDTPATWSELSPYEKAAAKKEKNTKDRVSRYKKKAGGKVEKFKPHMMYDPKTGKAYKANKMADHNRMNKKGYTHTKPKMKMGGNKTNDASVLKYFNDMKEQRMGGQYMQLGGAALRGNPKCGFRKGSKSCGPRRKKSGNGLNIGGKGKVKKAFKRAGKKIRRGIRRVF